MDLETGHRYPQTAALGYSQHYYIDDRNAPLSFANGTRSNPRGYPIGGPVGGGIRQRSGMGQEDGGMENNHVRRRIAVACARCRKRKIRCSGDPGDGTGCANCKLAGIEPTACQFHRVGSDCADRVLDNLSLAHSLTNLANPHTTIPVYNTSGIPMYTRATSNLYPSTWSVPYSGETSPIETYTLDQPGAYLPNQHAATSHYNYGGNRRWPQVGAKTVQGGAGAYLDHDTVSVYGAQAPPYIQTSPRVNSTAEILSPLNMSSLQLSLPERPHPRPGPASESTAPQRQLPIPQPSPAQASRNIVDQMQHQRLRSAPAIGSSSAAAYSKPSLPYSIDNGAQVATSRETSSTALTAHMTEPTSFSISANGSMTYRPVTTSVGDETCAVSAGPSSQLNFSTSNILDAMPAPVLPASYSNFRDYNLPMSTSAEPMTSLRCQKSQSNLHSFNDDQSSKRRSTDNARNDYAVVNGHHYTPRNQARSPHPTNSVDGMQRDSINHRANLASHTPVSDPERSF